MRPHQSKLLYFLFLFLKGLVVARQHFQLLLKFCEALDYRWNLGLEELVRRLQTSHDLLEHSLQLALVERDERT